MKVICITPIMDIAPCCVGKPFPQVGDILTVVEVWRDGEYDYYVFSEYDPDDIFLSDRFSPLSNIDETELINQKEEAYVR